jgi:hypothetical protein
MRYAHRFDRPADGSLRGGLACAAAAILVPCLGQAHEARDPYTQCVNQQLPRHANGGRSAEAVTANVIAACRATEDTIVRAFFVTNGPPRPPASEAEKEAWAVLQADYTAQIRRNLHHTAEVWVRDYLSARR